MIARISIKVLEMLTSFTPLEFKKNVLKIKDFKYRGKFVLNDDIYEMFSSDTVVMHPLPRDSRPEANEIDFDLDSNPNLAIFRQADNGIAVRMALLP